MVDLSVWPAAGGRWPVAGGRWSVVGCVAGGVGPVAGGRWSVAGGCGPVVVGPVAGGRWPVAGGCGRRAGGRWQWPVVWSGVWPVAGGRWSGRLPQRLRVQKLQQCQKGLMFSTPWAKWCLAQT